MKKEYVWTCDYCGKEFPTKKKSDQHELNCPNRKDQELKVEPTKICRHCKEVVNEKAKKCPHCTGDLRSWFRRHPFITFLLVLFIFISIISSSGGDNNSQKSNTNVVPPSSVKITLPIMDIYGKSEEVIKSTFSGISTDYFDAGLTPSNKIKITGFDIKGSKINVQIDYSVQSGEPYYIGYSFSEEPLSEKDAWNFVGFEKPKQDTKTNHGIVAREVFYWENSNEIYPFKSVQAIYESNGKVGKISFGMEDTNMAKGNNSLYYVPISQ